MTSLSLSLFFPAFKKMKIKNTKKSRRKKATTSISHQIKLSLYKAICIFFSTAIGIAQIAARGNVGLDVCWRTIVISVYQLQYSVALLVFAERVKQS